MGKAPAMVVVAEDDDELRELLVWSLRRDGLRIIELEDGAELLDYVNFIGRFGNPVGLPDLILTDVMMPGASGLDVIALARARGVSCPFVVLTAFADGAVERSAEALGNTTVLSKPQDLDVLREVVRARLAGESAAQP
jgi:two-component system cell cycle response regulator CpdR